MSLGGETLAPSAKIPFFGRALAGRPAEISRIFRFGVLVSRLLRERSKRALRGRHVTGDVMQEVKWTPAFRGVVTQAIWNCGWSRPATPRLLKDGQSAPVWACARLGGERRVCQQECETCPHWIHE